MVGVIKELVCRSGGVQVLRLMEVAAQRSPPVQAVLHFSSPIMTRTEY